ncbi:dihydroxy-acid dehydratase [Salmonella enterica subsp. enterica]|uniref:Dihydroxy-acid dehydratase n=1 Tax=Salmonella enterica I TaxID=59201 RepID=A0A379WKF7_SALET|nr:dihydroxy-acid dehydratase [Salmonella enterica subsp. enterica]
MSQKCQHARDLWSQLDALRLGMNYSKEDVNKLQVLVDDCYGESHPGSFHLNQLGDEAVLGVHESGGRAVRHHVTDICDGWGQGHDGMNYILASREAIANMVEIHASVVPYDAGILISSCDKSIPAHLIAAARLNLPLLHIPGGSMRPAPNMSTSDLGGITAKLKKGEIGIQQVEAMQQCGCPTAGACQFMERPVPCSACRRPWAGPARQRFAAIDPGGNSPRCQNRRPPGAVSGGEKYHHP